jgi:hypothetical protein
MSAFWQQCSANLCVRGSENKTWIANFNNCCGAATLLSAHHISLFAEIKTEANGNFDNNKQRIKI